MEVNDAVETGDLPELRQACRRPDGGLRGDCFKQKIEIGCDQADLSVCVAAEVEQNSVRPKVHIGWWVENVTDGAHDVRNGKVPLQQAKDSVGGNDRADTGNRTEILRCFDQFTGRAVRECPELGQNCPSEAEEIRQFGIFAGYPRAAEE